MEKILIVHSKYKLKGGEDIAVENEITFLKKNFEVKVLFFKNSNHNLIQLIFNFLFLNSPKSNKELKKTIESFNPKYIYFHNLWFAASLGLFKVIKETSDIKLLIKLHNFRIFCTSTYFAKKHLNSGEFCHACGFTKKKGMFFNKYFIDSYLKSIFSIRFSKKIFKILNSKNFKILVLTNFYKEFINKTNYEKNNVYVFPNVLNIKENISRIQSEKNLVYAGRISHEKGVEELLNAYSKLNYVDVNLVIIGTGPQLNYLKSKYSSKNIKFLGEISNIQTIKIISRSLAVITNTKLYEGQPTLLCEASILGIPSIFPSTGGINEFFPEDYQYSFEQFNYDSLSNKIDLLVKSSDRKNIGIENQRYISEVLNHELAIKNFKKIINDK